MTAERVDLPDGFSRRSFLRHAAWAGAGIAVAVSGGVVTTEMLGAGMLTADASTPRTKADFSFVQISDSHLGFEGKPNPDVAETFQQSIDLVNALPDAPDFVIHTGDLTHFSTVAQFDQAKQMMSAIRAPHVFTLPGEHDSIDGTGRTYLKIFGAGTVGTGWYSFDHKGVHFISLVNTTSQQVLGHLGSEQISWVVKDVAGLSSDTPIVVFTHIPLFDVYTKWGWGTGDAPELLHHLKRFASVTCLNGHIHQVISRVEGKVGFHSCNATAYPLPKPGRAAGPIPVVTPPGQLHKYIGIREADFAPKFHHPLVSDRLLPR